MSPLFLAVVGICFVPPGDPGAKDNSRLGGVRVAVVNVGEVFNKYHRAREFKADLEKTLAPRKEEAKKLTKDIERWQSVIDKKDFRIATKEHYEEKIIASRRQLEDMARKIQAELGKKQEQNLVALWHDVVAEINTVAEREKIDVVFGYGDPMEKDLLELFPNVNRKMQAMDLGGSVPLFAARRADISAEVVRGLNERVFRKTDPNPRADY